MNKEGLFLGVEEIITKKELEAKIKSGKKLKIKLGFDPTKPDLHLGHAVTLRKLKQFQDLGHTVIFLIGDFTTKIGDPSGRNTARPALSDAEIKKNAKTYFEQVGKVLDTKKCQVRSNSEWYSKMNFADIIQVLSQVTLAQVAEREDFKNRAKRGEDVGIHEIIYPIMQGYDSVILESNIEIGGNDQRLNMLMGREIQKKYGQPSQCVITMPLLIGTDGKRKMSKSFDNYIGLSDSPTNQFGKTMSIPDSIIENYLDLATDFDQSRIKTLKKELKGGRNPKQIKEIIAENIVKQYYGEKIATKAKKDFISQFQKKEFPDDIPTLKISGTFLLPALLLKTGATNSGSEARRLIEQGGVKIDRAKLTDPEAEITVYKGMVIQVGKRRFWKVE